MIPTSGVFVVWLYPNRLGSAVAVPVPILLLIGLGIGMLNGLAILLLRIPMAGLELAPDEVAHLDSL